MADCRKCGGKGWWYDSTKQTDKHCSECNGTGDGTEQGRRCSKCSGRGQWYDSAKGVDKHCWDCDGTGYK